VHDLPPRSPDLNLIENIWGIMVQRMQRMDITNKDSLISAIEAAWDSIDYRTIRQLFLSYPRRLKSILENAGGPTKY
jgi:transposase